MRTFRVRREHTPLSAAFAWPLTPNGALRLRPPVPLVYRMKRVLQNCLLVGTKTGSVDLVAHSL
jgi:hypothetical protein